MRREASSYSRRSLSFSIITANTARCFLLDVLRKGKDAGIDDKPPELFIPLLAH